YVLTDLTGAIVSRMARGGAGNEDPAVIVGRTATQIDILIDGAGVDRERILGVGLVSAANGSHPRQPAMRHWLDFPAKTELECATGLPVVIGKDATAAALGEYWAGSTDGFPIFAAISMGAHLGAGLLVNGLPHHGTGGFAGQIGHVCLDIEGPVCWCGARGCAEILAGPEAVVDAARADTALARTTGIDGEHPSVAAEFAAVVRAARRGDTGATALLESSAEHLAVAVRVMANIVDPDLLILTGPGLATAGPFYLPPPPPAGAPPTPVRRSWCPCTPDSDCPKASNRRPQGPEEAGRELRRHDPEEAMQGDSGCSESCRSARESTVHRERSISSTTWDNQVIHPLSMVIPPCNTSR